MGDFKSQHISSRTTYAIIDDGFRSYFHTCKKSNVVETQTNTTCTCGPRVSPQRAEASALSYCFRFIPSFFPVYFKIYSLCFYSGPVTTLRTTDCGNSNPVFSLQFAVLTWLLTYVGACFNGLTLLIIGMLSFAFLTLYCGYCFETVLCQRK